MIIPNKPHMCVPSILMYFCALKGEVFFCCFFHPCESAVKQQINYGWCNKYKIGKKRVCTFAQIHSQYCFSFVTVSTTWAFVFSVIVTHIYLVLFCCCHRSADCFSLSHMV